MPAYYNEHDSYAAEWLRNLIRAGHIVPGDVDERSIVDVRADDLRGYTQAHFFAGIAGWSLALRLVGIPDDRPIWTGSCPCQPFSTAGKRTGGSDERHLWPHWFRLIRECRPAIIFGENVEAAIGWGWLDAVLTDLEGEGYATGAAVLPACGVGAPHIRNRVWFVAHSEGQPNRIGNGRSCGEGIGANWPHNGTGSRGASVQLADAGNGGLSRIERRRAEVESADNCSDGCMVNPASEQAGIPGLARQPGNTVGELGHASIPRLSERECNGGIQRESMDSSEGQAAIGRSNPWHPCDWLPCTDGKARPVEPGTFPLASRVPGRVGRLRAYGNAIVPQVAAQFIKACIGGE